MPSPEIQSVVDGFRDRRDSRGGDVRSLAEIRAGFAPGGRVFAVPPDTTVTAVDAAGVPAHWLAPPGASPATTLVYLHGGGFTLGSLHSHGELAARLGRAAGARVLFPEYRLVPEHPFPAAVDDVRAVWQWLRAGGAATGPVLLAGDSAGAGLAMALLVALRDAGVPLPAGAVLFSPHVDLTSAGESIEARQGRDPIFTADFVRATARAYLAGADPGQPLASPLFAPLHGLPPLLVQVGSEELLFSDAERLVDAARSAGVEATLEVGAGLPHVYQSVADAPEARAATDRAGAFLRRAAAAR
jgi:monoterpene epsilon-lactone hydrolase